MTDTTDPTKPVAWVRWNEAASTSTGVTDTEYYRDLWTAEGDTVVPLVRLSEYERAKARSEAAEADNKRLREAGAKVCKAEQEFRSIMPPEWEGDPLNDAVAELRAALEASR